MPECNPRRSAVEDMLEHLENPFADLNTDRKWKKYVYSKWEVVQPVEVCLGVIYDSKRNSFWKLRTGTRKKEQNDKQPYPIF